MHPGTVAIGFGIGAILGSFLNMVIYRLPRAISFLNPKHSICPNCKHELHSIDLIPLLSWLSTGGKCRYCKVPIAPRYFLVEALMAILCSVAWWQLMVVTEQPVRAGFTMAAIGCLVAVIFIDWELYIIPDELNAFILVLGLAMHAALGDLPFALWGAFAGWAALWGITFFARIGFGKDAMGHGDIKLMRGIGAILGPALMGASVMMAVVLGLVVGIAMIALSRRQAAASVEEDSGEAGDYPPESIGSLLKFGVWYLLCLDVVGVLYPPIYRLIGEPIPTRGLDEEDDWKPSLTTIPFGPYLAAGALTCLLFTAPVENAISSYWTRVTGEPPAGLSSTGGPESGRTNEVTNGVGPLPH